MQNAQEVYAERMARVRAQMKKNGLQQLIVSDTAALFYLTGWRVEPGERMLVLLLAAEGSARLFVNRLFTAPDCGIPVTYYDDTQDAPMLLVPWLDKKKALGVDKNWPSGFLLRLLEKPTARELRCGSICVDLARAVKSAAEQERMAAASAANDACMARFAAAVRPGVTEQALAEEIKRIYAETGHSAVSFEPIVCFGPAAADPHHRNGETVFVPGMPVLLDVGGVLDDYCSDMTRTFFTQAPTDRQRLVYETVLAANRAGIAAVRPGVPLCEVDAAARRVIERAGFGPQFTHRLGHFIGLQDHEWGDVSAACTLRAQPGMCFSIEPGIYLPGEIGVRIEDLVIVTEDGCRVLNAYPKELTVLENF